MNNLQSIIVIAAWIAVPVSLWVIVYFAIRIYVQKRIRAELGDMPSAEEISALYASINQQNKSGGVLDSRTYYEKLSQEKDSPTDQILRS